ncbi:MAG: CDP-glucose 4,6-dehydratase [Coxiellaceae bacterium]|nr:CDP-glucose 4,6-dehydratase [Coxiellaceae bacterium]
MKKDFWHGKKVLITGHTGFKGSWLSLWLLSLGAEVSGYALEPKTQTSLFSLLKLKKRIDHTIADIRDFESLKKTVRRVSPDVIFHLAAQPLVRQSYIEPVYTYQTNIMGTVNVLEAIRNSSTHCALLNVTTDKCYENNESFYRYRETDPMGGYDPYSSSKACSEIISSAYARSFFSKHIEGAMVATARAGNVIGGGDWSSDRLIPSVITAVLSNESIKIRNPRAIRPWQHVLEPLYGYLLLAEKLYDYPNEYSGAWNFGPNEESVISVESLLKIIRNHWGVGCNWSEESNSNLHEASVLLLDSTKSNEKLSWKPRFELDEQVGFTISWYKSWSNNANMLKITLDQISEYESREVNKYAIN